MFLKNCDAKTLSGCHQNDYSSMRIADSVLTLFVDSKRCELLIYDTKGFKNLIISGVQRKAVWSVKLVEDFRKAWREKTFKDFYYHKENHLDIYK